MANKKSESKGFGVAALILGICGIIGAWIPILNWFSIPLGILALIFGIIAVVKTIAKGLGIAGIILGGLTIVVFIFINAILGAAIFTAANDTTVQQEMQTVFDNYNYTH